MTNDNDPRDDAMRSLRAMIVADLDQFKKWFASHYEVEPHHANDVVKVTWGSFRTAYRRTIELQRRYVARIDQLIEETKNR